MAINPVLYSSRSEEWKTPEECSNPLDGRFHFALDACANCGEREMATDISQRMMTD